MTFDQMMQSMRRALESGGASARRYAGRRIGAKGDFYLRVDCDDSSAISMIGYWSGELGTTAGSRKPWVLLQYRSSEKIYTCDGDPRSFLDLISATSVGKAVSAFRAGLGDDDGSRIAAYDLGALFELITAASRNDSDHAALREMYRVLSERASRGPAWI